jgi:hypothetical protein
MAVIHPLLVCGTQSANTTGNDSLPSILYGTLDETGSDLAVEQPTHSVKGARHAVARESLYSAEIS